MSILHDPQDQLDNVINVIGSDGKNIFLTSLKYFSYCKLHLIYDYQPKGKKEEVIEKDEVPEFIGKKIKSA